MNDLKSNTQFSLCPPVNGINKAVSCISLNGATGVATQDNILGQIDSLITNINTFYPNAVFFGTPGHMLFRSDKIANPGDENLSTVIIYFFDDPQAMNSWELK